MHLRGSNYSYKLCLGILKKRLVDVLFFLIFTFLCQPEDILSTLQKLSAHQWAFRILALSKVAQTDKKIRAKPESPFFMEGKFPLTSMGALPDYKIKKLAPNDISKGGFTHGTQLYLMSQISRIPLFFSRLLVNLLSEPK